MGFLVWYAIVAVGAGGLGAGLNCEGGECKSGFPSWWQPWTWDDYYVFPEAFYAALAGFVPAAACVYFAASRRWIFACVAFVASLALVSYAFFGGLTEQGRALGAVGLLLVGIAVLASGSKTTSSSEM